MSLRNFEAVGKQVSLELQEQGNSESGKNLKALSGTKRFTRARKDDYVRGTLVLMGLRLSNLWDYFCYNLTGHLIQILIHHFVKVVPPHVMYLKCFG